MGKKIGIVVLVLMIMMMNILVPVQEAQAFVPAAIALAEFTPEMISAIVTLIASGAVFRRMMRQLIWRGIITIQAMALA